MAARGKRIAMLIEQDFEDVEVTEPLKAFKDAGMHVTIIGNGSQIVYMGKQHKSKFKPDITADKVDARDFDALFIPGGYAPDKMRLRQSMIDLVKKFHDSGKLITAICHGPQILISAGIVRGHRMTSWPSVAVDLINAGAEWVDEPVVVDKDFITSRMPEDIPQFTRAVIQALERTASLAQAAG